ncbi:tRNA modification GTPase MSS1, mitochondrial [Candida viswanathii]|uniref:tRNA modification GTPase MSS1, mitochondrial n=1 Tax=Candida viswanathii TaxID=5486 RepID=A0A367YN41_9ASCO|nr:tRNA modification GTPase MSS1, mitochondrial [Candida viswanathii]
MLRRFLSTTSSLRPTVFALSTKLGKSAIAVVRISGPQAQYIYHKLTRSTNPPKKRVASVRKLHSTETDKPSILDEALTLYLPGPKTYTGEDMLELHLHGGIAIIRAVMNSITTLHSPNEGIIIRQADRGEFSRQAFVNGRLDLTELEGINEMINSETEQQRLANLSSSSGKTKLVFKKWRQDILEEIANLTTIIDFGEDHDLTETENLINKVIANIQSLEGEIKQYLKKVRSLEILLNGIKLTLLGPPNAGKSSILNTLVNKDAAIVSEIAGTTRDALDIPCEIGGFKVVIGDTAGIRMLEQADIIEREGIKRAKERSFLADLVIVVLDPTTAGNTEELKNHLADLIKEKKNILVVLNKQDLYPDKVDAMIDQYSEQLNLPKEFFQVVSCSTGDGMETLQELLVNKFRSLSETDQSDPVLVSSRIQDILENDILYGFNEFYKWAKQDDVVVATDCLTLSVEGIGKITGEYIDLDEILDVVFSNFCIGK